VPEYPAYNRVYADHGIVVLCEEKIKKPIPSPLEPVNKQIKAVFEFEESGNKYDIDDIVKTVDIRAVNEVTNETLVAIAGGPNHRVGNVDEADMN
jgi:hypothetical protein